MHDRSQADSPDGDVKLRYQTAYPRVLGDSTSTLRSPCPSRLAWNKRERERKRPGAVGPCEVGVAGPEANPAHSEAQRRAGFGALPRNCRSTGGSPFDQRSWRRSRPGRCWPCGRRSDHRSVLHNPVHGAVKVPAARRLCQCGPAGLGCSSSSAATCSCKSSVTGCPS